MSQNSIEYSRTYREKHRDKCRAANRAYSQKPEVKARMKEQHSTPEFKLKNAMWQRKWRVANRDKVKERRSVPEVKIRYATADKKNYEKLHLEVLNAYGGKCICCGESHPHFLSIDHINGGGKKDRKDRGCETSGNKWYRLLLKQHFDHIQILCYNCNMAKGHYGQCPHQIKKA